MGGGNVGERRGEERRGEERRGEERRGEERRGEERRGEERGEERRGEERRGEERKGEEKGGEERRGEERRGEERRGEERRGEERRGEGRVKLAACESAIHFHLHSNWCGAYFVWVLIMQCCSIIKMGTYMYTLWVLVFYGCLFSMGAYYPDFMVCKTRYMHYIVCAFLCAPNHLTDPTIETSLLHPSYLTASSQLKYCTSHPVQWVTLQNT